jgi:RNA polymerase sigma-70 factor (ECF subfamily)
MIHVAGLGVQRLKPRGRLDGRGVSRPYDGHSARARPPAAAIHPWVPIVMRPPLRPFRGRELRSLADEDLMALVQSGEARAFEVIFDRHSGPAFSLAYRMCARRAMAEDIVQEAFLSLWRSGARYDPARGSVRSWVLSAVHHRAIDAFRRDASKQSQDVRDESAAERLPAPELTEAEAVRRDEARTVRAALDELPAEQRHVIELAYFGGFTHTQIAEMLQLPTGTVKGRMRLGLAKLRISLGDALEALT